MELLDIMNERFSVRKYVDKPVEPEKLDKILNAAHAAPTEIGRASCRERV